MRDVNSVEIDAVKSIISSSPEPAVVMDVSGRIRSANKHFLKLLGYDEAELLGRPFNMLRDRSAAQDQLLVRIEKEGGISEIEFEYISCSGKRVPASCSAAMCRDRTGRPVAFIVTVRDREGRSSLAAKLKSARDELARRTTYIEDFREGVFRMLKDLDNNEQELEEVYRKLTETQEQLMQSSKLSALGELAAGIAHELKQPLTVIKGLSQSLLRGMDETCTEYEKVKLIVDASTKMEFVIKHLKVFSRTDEDDMAPVDINAVIKDASIIVKELLVSHSVVINLDLGAIPLVMGTPNRLEQVIINLVTNAKDAMPDGGALDISTRTIKRDGRKFAKIDFRDNGCGMDEETRRRVFEPFFTTKPVDRGTGLGLSISARIVKDHHGEMTVESTPGKGTVFTITIPAAEQAPPSVLTSSGSL